MLEWFTDDFMRVVEETKLEDLKGVK